MEITDNQLKVIYAIAGAIVIIVLAIKTNAFEFILGNFKIKGKKNNQKENKDQSINPTIQANNNDNSNVNIGGTQTIGELKKKKRK